MQKTSSKLPLFGLLSVMIGLVGSLNAGFLTYSELTGTIPPCRPPFQCEKVLTSPWLNLGVVPFPSLGLLYFLVVLGVGSWLVLAPNKPEIKQKILWVFSLFGLAFGLYTLVAMTLLIKGLCMYCLVSDALLFGNFGLNYWTKVHPDSNNPSDAI